MKNILLFLAAVCLYACDSDNDRNPAVEPVTQAMYPVNVTTHSAILTGKQLTGGGTIEERGFYYLCDETGKLTDLEETALHQILLQEGVYVKAGLDGLFQAKIDGLAKMKKFAVMSYVRTNVDDTYSTPIFFTTSAEVAPSLSMSAEYESLGDTAVRVSCNIDAVGGEEILERGVVVSNTPDPELENARKITAEAGYETYEMVVDQIQPLRKYYIRAYATNVYGTSYSQQVMVAFMADFFVDGRDGEKYTVKQYGNSIWMTQNFRYIPDGSLGSSVWVQGYDGTDVRAARGSENYALYGCLYSHDLAVAAAPVGWHLATDEEWNELEKIMGVSEEDLNKEDWRGGVNYKLKSEEWEGIGSWTNEAGFNLHPGGKQWCGGAFQDFKSLGYCWTATYSTKPTSPNPWYRFFSGGTGTGRFCDFPTCVGLSVRYVMD